MKTELNTYQRIQQLLEKAMVWGDEDEARLNYKNNPYELTGWLSGEEFEYEFLVNGEQEELEDPEQTLIFEVLRKEIDNERCAEFYNNRYEEPYFYLTHNH